jgi:uncharacterized membrane protein YfcA
MVGLAAGMFGVGGGFLLTPLLNVVCGVPIDIAVGTGLCQMIGTSVTAYRRHRRLGLGETKVSWLMLAGGLMGVQVGAQALVGLEGLGTIPLWGRPVPAAQYWLSICYTIVLTAIGIWMLRDSRLRPANAPLRPGPLARLNLPPYTLLPLSGRRVSILLLAYLGLLIGFLSGLLGIGGGIILLPLLLYGVGMRVKMAAGSGIILVLATSIVGTIVHARMGHVHLGLAMVLLTGSTMAAPVGAAIAHRMAGHHLRGLFAWMVMATAMAVLWNLARMAVR